MWTCEACGEEHDDSLTVCWICSGPRFDEEDLSAELSPPPDEADLSSSREVLSLATAAPDTLPSSNAETREPTANDVFRPPRLRFSLIGLLTVMTVMTVLLGVARWEVRMLPFVQVALVLAGVAVYCRAGALASALVGAAIFYVLFGGVVFFSGFGTMPPGKAMQAAWFSFVMVAPATLGVGAIAGYYAGAYNDRRRRREQRADRADLPSGAAPSDRG